ncbi:MAG: MarR family transcriptional regulator [Candidatus Bathyarchaeota archaeon]|nr:MarR family transcriptional regulator [Candidatus Bathyarchaeota archaeon]
MAELVLGSLIMLLIVIMTSTVVYYKQLRKAQKEYEKARDLVEDIVFSFNRELKREAERIEEVGYNAEGANLKADTGLKKAEEIEGRVAPLESQLKVQLEQIKMLETKIENSIQGLQKSTLVDTKIAEIERAQKTLVNKIESLEEQIQKIINTPEVKIESSNSTIPVVPIKRDKAIASLTDTEVAALEFLSTEGPKTAPEIKEKLQLSREHTARLMKKLYEEGYLERETGKLPFKYSIKEEMLKLLRKPEPQSK